MRIINENLKFVMIFALLATFFSCSEDDPDPVQPTADFTTEINEFTVNYLNTSENATSFNWDLGDDNTSTERHPTHTYEQAGTYSVTLTATGENGMEAIETREVMVEGPDPVAYFTFDVYDLTGTFINTSQNTVSYVWDFGDGNTSTEEHPAYTYEQEGTYTVTLTATGEDGTESVVEKEVSLIEPLVYPRNILPSGDMEDASAWDVYSTDTLPLPSVEFTEGVLEFSAEDEAEALVWQELEVPAAGTYEFSADVTGTGSTDMWFEVQFGTEEPVEGSGYTSESYAGMNTSDSETCGVEPFEGNLAEIACRRSGIDQDGLITFAEPATIYVVVKAGSIESLGTLTIDNLELSFVEE